MSTDLLSDGTTVREFEPGDRMRDDTRRIPAFAALAQRTGGVYVENDLGMGVEDALRAAGLDFVVRKHGPIGVRVPGGDYVQLGDGDLSDWTGRPDDDGAPAGPVELEEIEGLAHLRATVAVWPGQPDRPKRMLGVVGRGYPVVQPHQAAELVQAIVDESGGNVVAVCAYGEPRGSQMLLAVKMPDGILVAGRDPHDLYAIIGNSWNRASSLWGCVAPIRLECTNQVAATFGALANRFQMPHRGDMASKVDEARMALQITGTFAQRYAAAAEQMLNTPLAGADIDRYVEELFPSPEDGGKRAQDNAVRRRRHITDLIRGGKHNQFGVGTAYAAYQGVVEWLDYDKPAQSERGRASRLVDGGEIERLKQRAARLALQPA
jgi:phage/plasmid-like protein (TIGR03299 family)